MGVAAPSVIVHDGAGKGAWAGSSIALAARIPSLPLLQSLLALPMALAKNLCCSWCLWGFLNVLLLSCILTMLSNAADEIGTSVPDISHETYLSYSIHLCPSQADHWQGRKQNIPH